MSTTDHLIIFIKNGALPGCDGTYHAAELYPDEIIVFLAEHAHGTGGLVAHLGDGLHRR